MKRHKQQFFLLGAAVILLAIGIPVLLWFTDDSLKAATLADGTKIYHFRGSEVTPAEDFPQPRRLTVDGDVFFRVPEHPEPMIVNTKLMVLTVKGKSAFRVEAYSEKNGEQVDVLYGNVTAEKSYESRFDEPEELTGGQMVMINSTIDLMEKETLKDHEIPLWVKEIP